MADYSSPRSSPRTVSASRGFQLSRIQRHTVFREMVKGELRCGKISDRRRGKLIDYAGTLGIDPAEAAELLDEARRALGLPVPPHAREREIERSGEATRQTPTWLTVSIVVMALAIINVVLFRAW